MQMLVFPCTINSLIWSTEPLISSWQLTVENSLMARVEVTAESRSVCTVLCVCVLAPSNCLLFYERAKVL